MLQYAVSRLLGSYLAEYVQRVDGKSLDLALWDGDVYVCLPLSLSSAISPLDVVSRAAGCCEIWSW